MLKRNILIQIFNSFLEVVSFKFARVGCQVKQVLIFIFEKKRSKAKVNACLCMIYLLERVTSINTKEIRTLTDSSHKKEILIPNFICTVI